MRKLFAIALLFVLCGVAHADKYVRDGGSGNCSSWTNACDQITTAESSVTRGETIWVADGTYNGFTIDVGVSGSSTITIKKASASAHGTETGWSSTYGDGQAIIGDIQAHTNYIVIDGAYRNESDWGDYDAYGYKVSGISSIDDFGSVYCATNMTIRYVTGGTLTGTSYTGSEPDEILKGTGYRSDCQNWYVGYSALHNAAHYCIFCANGFDGATVEYTRLANGWGKEAIRGQIGFGNGTIRYNQFINACGATGEPGEGCTGEIAIWDDCAGGSCDGNKIYGNYFFRDNGDENSGGTIIVGGDGSSWVGSSASNTLVYNNTIAGIDGSTNTGGNILVNGGSGNICRNNLGYDIAGSFSVSCNTASNNSEVTSNPFVSYAAGDLHLSAGIAGYSLSSPYATDMDGVTRGGDGTFDVGALEYVTALVRVDFEDGTLGSFSSTYGDADVVTDLTTPNGTKSLMFTYPAGTYGGVAPDIVHDSFTASNEVWIRFLFKFSSGYDFNSVMNKLAYFKCGPSGGETNHFIGARSQWSEAINLSTQHNSNASLNQTRRGGSTSDITSGGWHTLVAHLVINTPGELNGVGQVWLDDELIINASDIRWLISTESGGFRHFQFTPVYGGGQETINSEQYLWFDDVTIQAAAFGGGGGDTSAPYPSQWSPAKSSTGVLATNRTISFHVQDDVDVLTSYGIVNIEGVDYTCAAGLSCTGGATDKTITYTKGSDWTPDQVVNITTSGFRDTAGNVMANDTWSYTIESEAPEAPTIDTTSPLTTRTQGTAFSQTLGASGGTSPYTWSITAGSLPAGTSLSSGGVFSGVPSIFGPFNFTAKIVDALAAEDTQAYALIVNPAAPGGQTTVNVTAIQDTFINSGDADNNVSTLGYTEVYQYPIGTVSNRILDNISFTLPDNVSIQSARLYMYVEGHEGSGGTTPMRVYAYRTGAQTISTVTWATFDNTLQTYESVTEVASDNAWYSWDVKNMVAWAYANSSPLYVALDGSQDGAANTNRKFTSMEGTEGFNPYLSITYMQLVAPEGPSISAPGKLRVTKMKGTFR